MIYIDMKKMIKSVFRLKVPGLFLMLGVILTSSSCNKDFNNTLPSSFKNDTLGLGSGSKKVLFIIMDGVRGSAIKTLSPANITGITQNSTFTYDGLADNKRNPITNAASWANMITGVDYTQHKVVTENFTGFDNSNSPTVFTRLKETVLKHSTASYSASVSFHNNLAFDASIKENFPNNDLEVKNAVVKNLTEKNSDLVVAQFNGAETAGLQGGYTTSNAVYVSQINALDAYIGEILAALNKRTEYPKENWLIIISSGKGGGATSGSLPGGDIYQDDSRNTFVAFYNPKFASQSVDKPETSKLPYQGIGPNLFGNSSSFSNAKLNNTTTGDFGASGYGTIMLKIRVDNAAADNAPFLGKHAGVTGSVPGWVCNLSGLNWVFRINSGGTFSRSNQPIRDGIWHTIAIRIYESNGRKMKTYTDGIPGDEGVAGSTNFSSPAPLTMGYIPFANNLPINVIIKDLAIYNVAIPEAELIPYMRKTVRVPADPYYSNLAGYWPCNEGEGAMLKDASGKSADFTISGNPNWKAFSDVSPNISPEISDAAFTVVPNGIDITYAIYTWMNIPVSSNWNLMGKNYLQAKTYPTN